MSGHLDGSLLKVFVAIIECKGFSAAAERLHKTQSTVSQSLQRLEEVVGTPLVYRTSRSVSLTPSGETFLIYARRILKLHNEAINAAHLPGEGGCIHVGMPEDYAQYCLAGVLRDFREHFPKIRPDICCEMSVALVGRLQRGELDLVLGVQHAQLQPGEFLCDEPLAWVTREGWAPGRDESVPLAVYAEGCAFRANAIDALAEAGRPWHVVYTSQSPRGIGVAIDGGGMVGVTARRLVPPGWRMLDEGEGFPPIEPARLMLWRATDGQDPELDALVAILCRRLRDSDRFGEGRAVPLMAGHGL
ncbi:LysR family transcriptional regulator [Pseudomonas gingeri]|uniref:LysR family transcriptional regulator n=1 Tax=Pseudomonas gingeri TaxID=117681 RepID=A0A7Y7YEN9_9PSED|nr:LysR family transcriptional regulator [Pseudomonas gingeri]NWA03373.1 LysR family transcriptional regulator [Pseudomonas gingeri]NWA14230.1 LysR family transcriptional regulator [Pseudomonas gingeri]NWA55152.1 LysR family transcriptional regulator [Pseudomonas gingeri]NWA94876.1 LysR family transcriptional regulator [Pseudomonas gingeri]NWB01532.1 LysR family transcriptional regulator [Pseudomonas gingeri]